MFFRQILLVPLVRTPLIRLPGKRDSLDLHGLSDGSIGAGGSPLRGADLPGQSRFLDRRPEETRSVEATETEGFCPDSFVGQPRDTVSSTPRRRSHILYAVLAAAVMTVGLAAILYVAWYPTTLQPNIVLSNAEYTTTACVPVGTGYANRYDWTFTLTNSGQADGRAFVRFGLGEYGLFRSYFAPRGAQVQATGLFYGARHPVASECTGPENPTVSLDSFERVPPIDSRQFINILVRAVSTAAFAGLLLGILAVALRRRGQSLSSQGGPWSLAFFIVLAAGFFSSAVEAGVQMAGNVPVDWPAMIAFGSLFIGMGLVVVFFVFRIALHQPGL